MLVLDVAMNLAHSLEDKMFKSGGRRSIGKKDCPHPRQFCPAVNVWTLLDAMIETVKSAQSS